MKKYSDLQVTDLRLDIELELVGEPDFVLDIVPSTIRRQRFVPGVLNQINRTYYLDLLTPFSIIIELSNKIYTTEYETAIIVKRLSVDGILIIPEYNHLTVYNNDHDFKNPTSYIGFNGKWTLTIDRPFYQWLHQAENQGWIIG